MQAPSFKAGLLTKSETGTSTGCAASPLRGYTLKETETIGRIDHPSGRSYKILELLNTETGVISLEGEQLQPFSSDIIKAIKSGYALKDCADERLRSTWKRLERSASDVSDSNASETNTSLVQEQAVVVEAFRAAPEAENIITLDEVEPVVANPVLPDAPETAVKGETQEPESSAPTGPVPVEETPFPLRDRRSPESPASESMRLQIAVRDRETDRLQATFARQESRHESETEAVESGTSDMSVSPESDITDMDNPLATNTLEAKIVTLAAPDSMKAELKNTHESEPVKSADPFALF
jgi:hypothetical protein